MWEKSFRKSVFLLIYNFLFKNLSYSDFRKNSFDYYYQKLIILENDFSLANKSELEKKINQYFQDFQNNSKLLSSYLKDWNKTFLIVKAILLTFLLEKNEVTNVAELTTKYLRLAQDYISSKNVSVVHAVIAKIIEN